MNKKYALPIAAASVLHAALLFGFEGTPEAVQRGEILACLGFIDDMPTTIEIVDFPELVESSIGEKPTEQIQDDPDAKMCPCSTLPSRCRINLSRYL
jgi:hypothetical protein